MVDVVIAPGDVDDPVVQSLVRALDDYLGDLYPSESNHGLSLEALRAPDVRFVVAWLDGTAIGCGAIRLDADFAELKRMYVVPEARGVGAGRRLLAHLEGLAADTGRPLVRLETGIVQPEAIALYERTGYRRIAPFPPYAADPLSLFMEKSLTPGDPTAS
jgi:putative acetyltransferase